MGSDISTLIIDFADMENVRLSAAEALNRFSKIHGLILSVGVLKQNGPNILASGHELMFATNVMGPFLFTLYVAFLPVLLYLAISSVFRFGLEKKVGALELLAYGPADGTSYFLAALIKDILMTAIYLVLLYLFLLIAALLNNLILGPSFYYSLIVLFFL